MNNKRPPEFVKDSLAPTGSIAMGAGVMIGVGILALTGQVTEPAGGVFRIAFIATAVFFAFRAYSYVNVCNESPLVGGMALIFGAKWWFLRKEAAFDDARD